MASLAIWSLTFIATLVVSTAGVVPVFVTGLIVHESISNSLTLLAMGVLAGLAAAWMANLFDVGGKRSRLLPTVIASEAAAAVLVAVNYAITMTGTLPGLYRLLGRNIFLLLIWAVILSLASCIAASRLRGSVLSVKSDVIASLVLVAAIPVVVVATIFIASLFGLTGA